MIIGIGADIIEIERVAKACADEKFRDKIFTVAEREMLVKKPPESAAGNFCCKEAAVKALGRGFASVAPIDVEALRDGSGAPVIFFHGAAREYAEALGVKKIHASVTHCKDYAAAFVVLEG